MATEVFATNDPIIDAVHRARRIEVHPQFLQVGAGEARLVKGYDAIGQFVTGGYGVQLVIHGASDIAAVSFPLNIRLRDIDRIQTLEKSSHAIPYCHLRNIAFTIDLSGSGYFSETIYDRELWNDSPNYSGSTTWKLTNPLDEYRWTLRDGTFLPVATPDGTIASGAHTVFNAFKATDLGEYNVKNITFYYPGTHYTGETMWVMLGNWSINGVEYQVMPNEGQVFYKSYTGNAAIAALEAPLTPKCKFRLLKVEIHLNGDPAEADNFVVNLDAGDDANYDTNLLTQDMNGSTSLVKTFGKGFEFEADDVIDIVYDNATTKTYGLRYAYEILP